MYLRALKIIEITVAETALCQRTLNFELLIMTNIKLYPTYLLYRIKMRGNHRINEFVKFKTVNVK